MRYNFFVNTNNFLLGVLMGMAFFGSEQAAWWMTLVGICAIPILLIVCRDRMREQRINYMPTSLRYADVKPCGEIEQKKAA